MHGRGTQPVSRHDELLDLNVAIHQVHILRLAHDQRRLASACQTTIPTPAAPVTANSSQLTWRPMGGTKPGSDGTPLGSVKPPAYP